MTIRWKDEARALDVGVRDLLEVGERHVREGLAWSLRARAEAGSEVHRVAATGRGVSYRTEVPIRWTMVVREWTCTVHGRIDGVEEEDGHTVIEEVKSTALDVDRLDAVAGFPEWEEQLAAYVFFASEARMPAVVGRLRVVSLVDGGERLTTVPLDPRLGPVLSARLDRLVRDREAWLHWQARRRGTAVRFPHEAWRPGQTEIAEACANAVRTGQHLLLTAPTGIGKTVAVMVGVLKAAAEAGLGVYWATARTTQQYVAEQTLQAIAARGTAVRAVTLRSREKACLNGVVDCRPEVCPFADGYADRLEEGVIERLELRATPTADEVADEARVDTLCPYELAVDWAARCDVVIGDYNQAFSPDLTLRRVFGERPWILVVDEAHQLPDRAVGYGSPALPVALADAVIDTCRSPAWAALRELAHAIRAEIVEAELRAVAPFTDCLRVELPLARWTDLRDRVDEVALDHARLRLAAPLADPDDPDPWTELGRALIRFVDALGRADEETVTLWSYEGLRLSCQDPRRILGPRFAAAHASVSLSATLAPTWYYRDRCGLEAERVATLVIPSPFPTANRKVVVVGGVSTAFRHRDRDRAKIVAILDEVIAAVPGNVALYFASYDHMRDLLAAATLAGRERLVQVVDASDAERAAVLDGLLDPGPPRVLCAVLGGSFAEGVDLPNEALQAAIVVGPALPPPSTERGLLQTWCEDHYDLGFELAYVVPGMTRVVQAAGRVVRSETDRGLVVLVCQRFLRTSYNQYLPSEWSWTRGRKGWVAEVRAWFEAAGTPPRTSDQGF